MSATNTRGSGTAHCCSTGTAGFMVLHAAGGEACGEVEGGAGGAARGGRAGAQHRGVGETAAGCVHSPRRRPIQLQICAAGSADGWQWGCKGARTCGSLDTSLATTCRRKGARLVLWCMVYPTALNRQLLSAAMGRIATTAEPSASGTHAWLGVTRALGPAPGDMTRRQCGCQHTGS